MTLSKHLTRLDSGDLVDVYRHWAGDVGMPTRDESLLQRELLRLMTDQDRVLKRFRELPAKCRDFLSWLLNQEDYAFPVPGRGEEGIPDLPISAYEVDAVAFALRKRGFLMEARNLTWLRHDQPAYLVPHDLGEVLATGLSGGNRPVESQWSLRGWLRAMGRAELERAVVACGLPKSAAADRSALVSRLSSPERISRAIASFEDEEERSLLQRVLGDHGGVGEARHLERMGFRLKDAEGFKQRMESLLLGTILDGDLADVGLQFGRGSVLVFFELVKAWHSSKLDTEPEDHPQVSADILADIAAIRTFLDHHTVRVTRDGDLYRATKKKMASEVLSPGERPLDPEESLKWLLRFMEDAELIRPDRDGRLRNTKSWEAFDKRGPTERTELLLTHVENDLREARGAFHLPRMRRIFMSVLREAGTSRWLALRSLAIIARNRYFMTMDRPTLSERFQQRYKFAPVPPLANPSALINELVRYGGSGLAFAGVVDIHQNEEGPAAIKLTRMGAALLGLAAEAQEEESGHGALIMTADFEIVIFPDYAGIDLIHEVARFAKREKADMSLHYRVTERSVQEAVASGLDAEAILEILDRHGRYEVPQNVRASIAVWAESVHVLQARKTLLVRARSKAALDQLLKIREIKAIALERLNDTTLELKEDPSTAKITETLRSQGFFLR